MPVENALSEENTENKANLCPTEKQLELLKIELKESELRYRNLFEASTDGILATDIETKKFIYANPAICEMLGYTEAELKNMNVSDIHPKDSLNHILSKFEAQSKGEKLKLDDIPCRKKTGEIIYTEITSNSSLIDGKKCNIGFFRDITARKEATRILIASEEKYKMLAENITDVVWLLDVNTKILTYLSPSIFKLRGYTQEEAIAHPLEKILSPESLKYAMEELNRALLHDQTPNADKNAERVLILETYHKDGSTIFVETNNKFIRDSKGAPVSVIGTSRDITKRIKAQKELKKNEKKYKDLIENLNEGIWVVDKDNITTFTNIKMSKMLGCEEGEMLGKSVFLFMDKEGIKIAEENFERGKKGIKEQHDFEFRKKDGTKMFAVIETAPVMDDSGNYDGAIAGVVDITDRKKLEEQLLQSQKMESIGVLAGGIAHDFNNLLTAITGYSEISMKKTDKNNPVYNYLIEISKASDRASNLTRQLLLFSRKQYLKPVCLNLNIIIEDLIKMLNRIIGEDITIKIDLQPGLCSTVSDASKIEQIIINLALNSRDAMKKGGKLTIKTENTIISPEDSSNIPDSHPGNYIKLSIEDNGAGMTKEIMQHIFEPFYTTKGLGKGTGLGLSVVYGIVKQHNGWINVYSEPGKGTIFTVYLPSVSENTEAVVEKEYKTEDLAGGGEGILIIEDEEAIRKYAGGVLLENGYTVFSAGNADEAFELFKKEKMSIQLVLSDVILPDKNGIELVSQLLLEKPELKSIFCSGYLDDRSQQQLLNKKGYKFLHKPYKLNELLTAVKETLAGEKQGKQGK